MTNLLRTEWLKMKNYWAFWGVLAMTSLSYPAISSMFWYQYQDMLKNEKQAAQLMKMFIGNPFSFPEAFHTVAFFSSIFVLIPGIMVIMLITNEYTYKTNRQNIIDGWSRDQFLLAKFLDVFMITLLVTIIYTIVAISVGVVATEGTVANKWSKADYIGLFALQTFAQLSLAFLIGFIIRRAFLALGTFLFYYVIAENLVIAYFRAKFKITLKYLPLEISDRVIPSPAFMRLFNEKGYKESLADVRPHIFYTFLLIIAIWGFCWWLNRKRDL